LGVNKLITSAYELYTLEKDSHSLLHTRITMD
jgi:hypothetical protein